jgi:hypothetical protein
MAYIIDRGLQDPNERLDWTRDWSDWLPEGDSLDSSEWIVVFEDDDPAPLEIMDEVGFEATFDETTSTVWLQGGTLGTSYEVTNRITTVQGRIKDETMVIECAST